jgi:hypothetical protein
MLRMRRERPACRNVDRMARAAAFRLLFGGAAMLGCSLPPAEEAPADVDGRGAPEQPLVAPFVQKRPPSLASRVPPGREDTLAAAMPNLTDAARRSVEEWLWLVRLDAEAFTDAEFAALVDLRDPSGRVDIECLGDVLCWAEPQWAASDVLDAFRTAIQPELPVLQSYVLSAATDEQVPTDNEASALAALGESRRRVLKAGLAPADADRLTLRLMLKACGIPDRVVTDRTGVFRVQVLERGTWRELGLP